MALKKIDGRSMEAGQASEKVVDVTRIRPKERIELE